MHKEIPFSHSSIQLYPSWVYVVEFDCWAPPVGKPELTPEQIFQKYDYMWDEDLYQQNGAMGNTSGWVLVRYLYEPVPVN